MKATVRTFVDWLESVAPFETAEAFDNCGLLLGKMDAPVSKVLIALDATPGVVKEAVSLGAELIISHHPLFFHARKNLREDDYEGAVVCELIRNHIALISAHTNIDKSELSGSYAVCEALHLRDIRAERYLYMGELPDETDAGALNAMIGRALCSPSLLYGDKDKRVRTVAVTGGSYGVGFDEAIRLGAQAFVTGEAEHHQLLAAAAQGLAMITAGHFATENILVPRLCKCLQNAMNAVECIVEVYPSAHKPYDVLMA